METFTKKIQGYKNKCHYPLQYSRRIRKKPRRSHCCAPVHLLYFIYSFFRFCILPDKGAIYNVCYGTSDYPPHLPPVCTKGRAAGCGGRYRAGRAAVLLRGKPAGGASGAGAKPGDGGQGTAAGQMGWLSAAGAGHAQGGRTAHLLCSCGAGYRHPRRPCHRHRHCAGKHDPCRMGQGRGQLHHGRDQ